MKRSYIYLPILFFNLIYFFHNASAQDQYSKRIDINGQLEAISGAFFYKDRIITYGQGAKLFGSPFKDIERLVLASLDLEGNLLYHKSFDSILVRFGNNVLCEMHDTLYAVVQTLNKNKTDTTNLSFIKMTTTFDSISSVMIPTKKNKNFSYYPFVVLPSIDSNIYCLLRGFRHEVLKISRSGVILNRAFVMPETYHELYCVMMVSKAGDVYFTAAPFLFPNEKVKQPMLIKFDKDLKLQWRKTYPDINDIGTYPRIKERKDGSIIFKTIPNLTIKNVGLDTDFVESFVMYNVDTAGKVLWRLPVYVTLSDGSLRINGMDLLHNDDIVLSGQKTRSEKVPEKRPSGEGWLMRISKDGKFQWERRIRDERGLSKHSISVGSFASVLEDASHRLYACGTYSDTFPNYKPYINNDNIWIVRLDSMGCFSANCSEYQTVGLNDFIVIGDKPTLVKVFPNPVNEFLNIDFQGNEIWTNAEKVNYEVLNTIGQIVKQGVLFPSSDIASLSLNDLITGHYTLHFFTKNKHGFAKIQKE